MENTKLQKKFEQFMEKEKNKKTLIIVLCCIGALVLAGAGAYLVYRFFFAKEDEYDLYDELDFYYDDDEEAEEEKAEEECECGCSEEAPAGEAKEECCCAE